MATKSEVEAEIDADGAALSAIVRLLKSRQPLDLWPDDLLAILSAALAEAGNAAEMRKAISLRRHLFRGANIPPNVADISHHPDTPGLARRSERVRADLAGVVDYGCGARLGM